MRSHNGYFVPQPTAHIDNTIWYSYLVCARHAAAHRVVIITAAHDAQAHRADLQQVHSSRAACALDSPAIVPHHTRDRTAGGLGLWSLVPPRSVLDLFLFSTAVRKAQCAASK